MTAAHDDVPSGVHMACVRDAEPAEAAQEEDADNPTARAATAAADTSLPIIFSPETV
ncbi:hypothetical protein Pmi06nite_18230 [Planotetraspora mira]|jgi:hypothetical protein|uniref:Uncharacterized protein n=1 Tax=Planotetraspora mira TaxID=58121 RepID=A0A8J3TMA1_9ACTN|nr:hypothetical protein Pmi06nite_18230 [Planotetraspora mira]